jgi:hypothetical protein
MSYTYVIMEVSDVAYEEIRQKLLAASYEHALHDRHDPAPHSGEVLDMHGIALQETSKGPITALSVPWIVHRTGSHIGIRDANGEFVIRKVVSTLTAKAYDRLSKNFEHIVGCVNRCGTNGRL